MMKEPVTELNREISSQRIARNIQAVMDKKEITTAALAQHLLLPYNTVNRIVTGTTTDPRISTLKLIADYLQVSLDELVYGSPSINMTSSQEGQPTSAPLFTWDQLTETQWQEKFTPKTWSNWIPIPMMVPDKLSPYAFALEAKRTMQPRFPLGTVLIVDPAESPRDGDLVIIRMSDTGEISVKELVIDPPSWQLKPVVSESATINFEKNQHEVIGVIVLTMMHSR